MSERCDLPEAVREMAVALVRERGPALDHRGLRASVEMRRWSIGGRDNAEIRITFWRGDALVDVIEDLVINEGRRVASNDELRVWLEQSIDAVVEEN